MRNFGQILIKNQQKIQEELSDLLDSGAEAGSVKTLGIWLKNSLIGQPRSSAFDQIFLKNQRTIQLLSAEGTRISKRMSYFLCHNLPPGQYGANIVF